MGQNKRGRCPLGVEPARDFVRPPSPTVNSPRSFSPFGDAAGEDLDLGTWADAFDEFVEGVGFRGVGAGAWPAQDRVLSGFKGWIGLPRTASTACSV